MKNRDKEWKKKVLTDFEVWNKSATIATSFFFTSQI